VSRLAGSFDVTVVMPAYQAAEFISATLDTIAAQRYAPRAIVVVDDGSSDGTPQVVERFARAYAGPVTLLVNAHQGPGAARNAGVRAAATTWIAFLDSDDLWHPDKLAVVAAAIEARPDANLFCHNEVVRQLDGSERTTDYGAGYRADRPLPPQLYETNYFSTSAVVCRRDLILQVGGFDESLSSAQDYELWLRLSPSAVPVFVPQALGEYVMRAGNITTRRFWRRLRNLLVVKLRHRHKVVASRAVVSILRVTMLHLMGPVRTRVRQLLPRRA
jgi:glycosyltransferase involved in cell wall biosynthesis